MWTSNQLAAMLRNKRKDARHENLMATDEAYRAKIEREEREYEEFVKTYGEPLRD